MNSIFMRSISCLCVVDKKNEESSVSDTSEKLFKLEKEFKELLENPHTVTEESHSLNPPSLVNQKGKERGELVTEKTLSYITQEKKATGENVIHQLVSHIHTSNVQAPFATDFDGPIEHLPAINPVSFTRHYVGEPDVPPPKKVVLSKGLRKKVELRLHLHYSQIIFVFDD